MAITFPFKSIIIICSVNTARSPMAEAFLKDFFTKNNLSVDVCSGGIASNARDGMLISIDAQDAMAEVGIKLSSTALSIDLKKRIEMIENSDLILTLTDKHKDEILKINSCKDKEVYTLREFAGDCGDIGDPSMKGIIGFRIARDEIRECIEKGLKKYE